MGQRPRLRATAADRARVAREPGEPGDRDRGHVHPRRQGHASGARPQRLGALRRPGRRDESDYGSENGWTGPRPLRGGRRGVIDEDGGAGSARASATARRRRRNDLNHLARGQPRPRERGPVGEEPQVSPHATTLRVARASQPDRSYCGAGLLGPALRSLRPLLDPIACSQAKDRRGLPRVLSLVLITLSFRSNALDPVQSAGSTRSCGRSRSRRTGSRGRSATRRAGRAGSSTRSPRTSGLKRENEALRREVATAQTALKENVAAPGAARLPRLALVPEGLPGGRGHRAHQPDGVRPERDHLGRLEPGDRGRRRRRRRPAGSSGR